jgi:hypothetical protein
MQRSHAVRYASPVYSASIVENATELSFHVVDEKFSVPRVDLEKISLL